MLAFAPDDGMPRCWCDRCAKLANNFDGYGSNDRDPVVESSMSNEWFYFVNRIMNEVNKEFPDFMIATNGYANRDIPPETGHSVQIAGQPPVGRQDHRNQHDHEHRSAGQAEQREPPRRIGAREPLRPGLGDPAHLAQVPARVEQIHAEPGAHNPLSARPKA